MRIINRFQIAALTAACTVLLTACPGQTATKPEPFTFAPKTAEPGAIVTSDEVVMRGISVPVTATVTAGGVLVVNGDEVASGTKVANLATLAVRVTASTEYGQSVEATVDVGGTTADFTVTTRDMVAPSVTLQTDPTNLTAATPGQEVELSWTVTGDFDSLELTSDHDPTAQDVTGLTSLQVTIPADRPSVTYTLTAHHAATGASDAASTGTIAVPLWVCARPADVITFEDAALEARFRTLAALSPSDPMTCADAAGVQVFETFDWQGAPGTTESLVGMQHLVNLRRFKAQFNEISDLTPLSGLTSLEVVDLDGNRVTDLSPLADLTQLELLGFWDNGPMRIDEAPPGAGVEDYCYDGITDLSPVAGLTNVKYIYLSCNGVTSLAPLAGMADLELLFVISNRLTSIQPLQGLANLQILRFSDNRVATTGTSGVLASLAGLRWLEFAYNNLEDAAIVGLGGLTDLFAVDMEGNYVSDLAPLIDNADFPAAVGSGDPQEPADPTVRLAYNCIADVPTVTADLNAKGVDVPDSMGPQKAPAVCSAGPQGTSTAHQQALEQFRLRTHGR